MEPDILDAVPDFQPIPNAGDAATGDPGTSAGPSLDSGIVSDL